MIINCDWTRKLDLYLTKFVVISLISKIAFAKSLSLWLYNCKCCRLMITLVNMKIDVIVKLFLKYEKKRLIFCTHISLTQILIIPYRTYIYTALISYGKHAYVHITTGTKYLCHSYVPHFDTYLGIIFKTIAVLSAQFIILSSKRSLTNWVEAGGSHDGIPEANK